MYFWTQMQSLSRKTDGLSGYTKKPSPVGEGGSRRLTDEVSYAPSNSSSTAIAVPLLPQEKAFYHSPQRKQKGQKAYSLCLPVGRCRILFNFKTVLKSTHHWHRAFWFGWRFYTKNDRNVLGSSRAPSPTGLVRFCGVYHQIWLLSKVFLQKPSPAGKVDLP